MQLLAGDSMELVINGGQHFRFCVAISGSGAPQEHRDLTFRVHASAFSRISRAGFCPIIALSPLQLIVKNEKGRRETCEGDACAILQAEGDQHRRAYWFRNLGERVIRLSITGDTGAIALSLRPDEIL